jgi:hypothetical protein
VGVGGGGPAKSHFVAGVRDFSLPGVHTGSPPMQPLTQGVAGYFTWCEAALLLGLRMRGAISPFPYMTMWCGTELSTVTVLSLDTLCL